MRTVTVRLSDEVMEALKPIFARCDPQYFRGNEDEYLLYLLRHMARLCEGNLPAHIYENHYAAGSAGFEQELAEVVRLTAISVNNMIAHRNLGQNEPPIDVD